MPTFIEKMARSTKHFISLAIILLWCLRLQQKFFTDPGLHVPVVSVPVSMAVLPVLNSRAAFMRVNCRHCNHRPLFSSRHPKFLVFFLLLIAGDVETNPGQKDNPPAPIPSSSKDYPAATITSGHSSNPPAKAGKHIRSYGHSFLSH